jgi:hypothetical protein
MIQNESARMIFDRYGGAIIDFRLFGTDINPFTWELTSEQMPENNKQGAAFRGHFVCLGRWGAPTKGEMQAGVPHNGQASNQWWNIVQKKKHSFIVDCNAPLDHMYVKREFHIDHNKPVVFARETVKNFSTVGRFNNIVQHPTIGPPFLNDSTVINTNADKGFLQECSYPNPCENEYNWPFAVKSDSTIIDLRRSNIDINYVTTHIFSDTMGWVSAYDPNSKLLLAYVFSTDEHPWLNIWHQTDSTGNPVAKGLEFGTTGIGRPYQDLLKLDTRFHGQSSFTFLDAGETVTKSYYLLLTTIDKPVQNIGDIIPGRKNSNIRILDQDKKILKDISFSFKTYNQ